MISGAQIHGNSSLHLLTITENGLPSIFGVSAPKSFNHAENFNSLTIVSSLSPRQRLREGPPVLWGAKREHPDVLRARILR